MKTVSSLALVTALLGLSACNRPVGPMVGGPCSYETSTVNGTVTEVDEDGALLMGTDGEFWVPASYLGMLPDVGDTLTLTHEHITEGTCTPDIYTVIKRS